MIAQVIQILTAEGQALSQQIKNNTPKVTGKSAQSVGYEVTSDDNTATLKITAKPFFKVVETGRGPTKSGSSSAGKSLVENIKEWLKAKGESNLGVAYYIAKKIHKEGTQLYKDGGRKDIFSNVLSDRAIEKLSRNLQDVIAGYYLQEFLKNLEQNKIIKDARISS